MSTEWSLVIATVIGCYGLKLAGFVVPARVLADARVRRLVELLPVALLAALVVVQTFAAGRHFQFDAARTVGVGVAAVAIWRRAPFLVVVALAGLVAALLRLA